VTIQTAANDEGLTFESIWVQAPLPFPDGQVVTWVIIRTAMGRVAVPKEWYDRVVLLSPGGAVHWRWLLSLLEAQLQEQETRNSQPPFDTDGL
jgi:hypothetical protein